MWERLKNEPAVLFSFVEALIALLIAFGLELTGEQTAAVVAVIAVLTGVGVRQTVYGPKTVDTIMDAETVIRQAEREGFDSEQGDSGTWISERRPESERPGL